MKTYRIQETSIEKVKFGSSGLKKAVIKKGWRSTIFQPLKRQPFVLYKTIFLTSLHCDDAWKTYTCCILPPYP